MNDEKEEDMMDMDDGDDKLQMEHCDFQLILYVDWLDEILIFEWMKHRWLILRFDLFSLMEWKSLVKMKLSAPGSKA